jgi:hypothetical protein
MSAGKRGSTRSLGQPLNRGSLCVFVADNGNQDKVQRETNQHAHTPQRESKENVHILGRFSSSSPDRKEKVENNKTAPVYHAAADTFFGLCSAWNNLQGVNANCEI